MDGAGQIRAIVFDANVFGGSVEPNIATIVNWSEACGRHDAELWIPEVVAWELAQRVVQECEQIARQVEAHNGKRRKWGFPHVAEPPLIDDVDVVERLESAGAVIVPLGGDAAVSAIRDQVLLRGPGSRRREVKTGAADSAWIRSVIAYNSGETTGLILVTGDVRAVTSTCESLDLNPPKVAKNLGEIRHLLDETTEANDEQRTNFVSTLSDLFTRPRISQVELRTVADLSYPHNWWSVDLGMDSDDNWEIQSSSVQVVSVEVTGVVQYDAWTESLSGPVRIEVEVEEQYARQDRWGDAPEYRSFFYTAWIQGDLTLFGEQKQSLDSIEIVDVEFVADPTSVYSQAL
ncbi:hypothetical protein OWR29_26330 [Actinoplanes sp. Pm04-4]|uniref:DUF4935 domain-containing protein n=1 Tax=Paractinoplanes pyxinae TaxID=2997416 RepID=A0ABT4B4W3_9ACTN|nr:hypothetical protein [Actinoplanes pyxinae]MCY1141530.1 hypothetical protein [Actinoplanes pyxinae]